ncbi:MAG TPA: ParB/RepB/Spo0J family partition protein [Candidatus Dojkabacteria bacterium]|jgi:ParB family chromosome partitioning protein|uniref:ParB/RepB/Spo0J family partition protein n=1 Tax=Candidatus Dojkabacteria bacterium TaxID=2099670 RepID=A0A847D1A6_9BACT|nr:ParB/RepB/Spo0J family partition protein [Candidatus Dojkabacteria bacterium]NLD25622.1 ParB/RepB/Spo0J family partition protein [Candidatus Dojkabacteria bacterium]HNW32951.1 ParB/RepB/Spo0J family partition protein [Candidatus Dojkabacteria bacterium]HQC39518.1 ParB/RepB/Spo0J family partition protein [Candidatus Dojkabacteria bacterium]HRZ84588.1 ParB/RepB/Spo0J family partition protein [Candidatus Dojkabacteria bacterium]
METDRLGKGLAALISSNQVDNSSSSFVPEFSIELIEPNPYQPRMHIDPNELIQIADSIREHGIVQPLIITRKRDSDRYYLIAGERRLRASQLAGFKTVPVVIKDSSPQEMLELAIIENVQRQDLNPIEEASAYKQMQDEFGMSHDEIAKRVGFNRVTITNKIRLLNIPEPVKEDILNGKLSEGHARALLGIKDKTSLIAAADLVVKRGMSVREAEALARKISFGKGSSTRIWKTTDEETNKYSDMLSRKLGYTAHITKMTKGGKLVIRYNNVEELNDLMKKLL